MKPLGQLKPNFSGMYNFFFYADWKSKLATISSHRFMGDPVGNQSLEGLLQTLYYLCWSEFQDDYHCRT